MAVAPQPILDCFARIQQHIPEAQLSGVVGDAAHSFGYHLAPNELPASDYSLQLAADKRGAKKYPTSASALDVTLPSGAGSLMTVVTKRLVKAAKENDPRLRAVREFCGTVNGTATYPWDVAGGDSSEGVGTWDDSHLWHVHTSFLRDHSYDAQALLDYADLFGGVPLEPDLNEQQTKAIVQAEIVDAMRTLIDGQSHGDWVAGKHSKWAGALGRLRAVSRSKRVPTVRRPKPSK